MRVLIVEDSQEVAERLEEMLQEVPGFESAGTAGDMAGAASQIALAMPDVILLDLQIRGGSGMDILRAVKLNRPKTIVIVLTNHASLPIRQACLQAGADYFLDKSAEFNDLPAVLAGVESLYKPASLRASEPEVSPRRKAAS